MEKEKEKSRLKIIDLLQIIENCWYEERGFSWAVFIQMATACTSL